MCMPKFYNYMMGLIFILQLLSIPFALILFIFMGGASLSQSETFPILERAGNLFIVAAIIFVYLLLFKAPLTAMELNKSPKKSWSRIKAMFYLLASGLGVLLYSFILILAVKQAAVSLLLISLVGVVGYGLFIQQLINWLSRNKIHRTVK